MERYIFHPLLLLMFAGGTAGAWRWEKKRESSPLPKAYQDVIFRGDKPSDVILSPEGKVHFHAHKVLGSVTSREHKTSTSIRGNYNPKTGMAEWTEKDIGSSSGTLTERAHLILPGPGNDTLVSVENPSRPRSYMVQDSGGTTLLANTEFIRDYLPPLTGGIDKPPVIHKSELLQEELKLRNLAGDLVQEIFFFKAHLKNRLAISTSDLTRSEKKKYAKILAKQRAAKEAWQAFIAKDPNFLSNREMPAEFGERLLKVAHADSGDGVTY